ncbi:acyltransferase family protein [Mycobacterium sp. 050134]|uniref:acyltransferase family protein n=1 Tax=Mycobacterium sp. 050134 TaxID=3096111 RepID=UPI002ED7892D
MARSTERAQARRATRPGFRPDIEGLRAVAVLAVVLFHADVPGVGGGFVGVDVFFVISGFLITGMLCREVTATGTVRLRSFYGARARRLLPASVAVGVAIMIATAVLLPVLRARKVVWDGIASALYVSNYRFAWQGIDYLAASAPPSPFQHYWSLGVEEQFYLVWPAMIIATAWLVRVARRTSRGHAPAATSARAYLFVLTPVAVASFALSLVLTETVPPVAFFSLPTRAWQLAVGGLVALTADRWRRLPAVPAAVAGWVGLAAILLACNRLGPTTPYPGTAALWPALGAALVIGAGCAAPAQGCGRFLGLPPMRAVGRVSYSWYLWHWPLLAVALWSVAPVVGHARWLALAAILTSGGLAVLTYRFVETPLRFAPSMRRSALASLALGGAATAAAVCMGVALLVALPVPVGRGPAAAPVTVTAATPPAGSAIAAYDAAVRRAFAQVQAAVAASANLKAVPANLDPSLADAEPISALGDSDNCFRGFYQDGQPECATGDTASKTTVALIGDSNAAMWSPAFQEIATRQHWRLETLSKAACPPLDLPVFNPALGRQYTECTRWSGQILARLGAEHPRLVIVSVMRRYGAAYGWRSGFTSYDSAWIGGLNRLVHQGRGSGAQVLVLGPIPDPHASVPDCLSGHLDDATACSAPPSAAVNQRGISAESAAVEAGGGQYADLSGLFCTAQRCPAIVGNALVYRDENHVTDEYARLLTPVMETLAVRALVHS